jgi:hypothetical protein
MALTNSNSSTASFSMLLQKDEFFQVWLGFGVIGFSFFSMLSDRWMCYAFFQATYRYSAKSETHTFIFDGDDKEGTMKTVSTILGEVDDRWSRRYFGQWIGPGDNLRYIDLDTEKKRSRFITVMLRKKKIVEPTETHGLVSTCWSMKMRFPTAKH